MSNLKVIPICTNCQNKNICPVKSEVEVKSAYCPNFKKVVDNK